MIMIRCWLYNLYLVCCIWNSTQTPTYHCCRWGSRYCLRTSVFQLLFPLHVDDSGYTRLPPHTALHRPTFTPTTTPRADYTGWCVTQDPRCLPRGYRSRIVPYLQLCHLLPVPFVDVLTTLPRTPARTHIPWALFGRARAALHHHHTHPIATLFGCDYLLRVLRSDWCGLT